MSTVHLHLMLNHVPVVGTFFLIALFGIAFLRRNATLTRTALWTWMAIAAVSLVVFLTGEPAEEAVEGVAGISEGALERHEDLAKFAMIAMGAGGLVSALALLAVRGRASLSRALSGSGLAFSLLLAALMGVTANLGGQIRHTEIRDGATIAAAGEERERGGGDDDDDGPGR